jgi:hypothetical protein
MAIGTLATVFGVVFLLVGVLGFFAAPPPPEAAPLTVDHGHGLALGMFPVNTLHNVVHLLFGALGLLAARGVIMSARGYFQFLAVAYGALAVLGAIPATQTTFGLIPIYDRRRRDRLHQRGRGACDGTHLTCAGRREHRRGRRGATLATSAIPSPAPLRQIGTPRIARMSRKTMAITRRM